MADATPVLATFVSLRCPDHRRARRRPGNPLKGIRAAEDCERCRTVWAAGCGPNAIRDEEPGPPEPLPPGRFDGPS